MVKPRWSWVASAAVHVVVIAVLAVGLAPRTRPAITFINLGSPVAVNLLAAPGSGFAAGPRVRAQPMPPPPSPAATVAAVPVGRPDSIPSPARPAGPVVQGPRMSDARIFPVPRPALPPDVADALYNPRPDTEPHDTTVVRRLRAMVDSLNKVIDQEQREHRLPSWTTDVAGKKFGLDSSSIYIAGVKIPAAALAFLGNLLPQGNWDESQRAQHMADIREDILQAARRTETLQEFRRYVHELRERKQAERDADARARGDTAKAKRDTVKAVP